MPDLRVQITARVADLLRAGVISITTEHYGSGVDCYARVMAPHPRIGVYPHESHTLEDIEPLLAKVRVPETNYSAGAKSEDFSAARPSSKGGPWSPPTKRGTATKVQCRDDPKLGMVPAQITVNGVANTLPKDTLCWKDLQYLSDHQLNQRIKAVGALVGPDKAVSKITSSVTMSSPSASTLKRWWNTASNRDRFILLTSQKKVGTEPKDADALLSRLGDGQYPFRGSDREMEEERPEIEEAFGEDFETEFNRGLVLYSSDESED